MRYLLILVFASCVFGQGLPGGLAFQDNLTKDQALAWERFLGIPKDCQRDEGEPGRLLEFWRVSASRVIAHATCVAGAYQSSGVFFAVESSGSEWKPRLLEFLDFEMPASKLVRVESRELYGEREWVPSRKALVVYRKFSQTGDCGLRALYSLAEAKPALLELRGKLRCDGRAIQKPQAMPLLRVPK